MFNITSYLSRDIRVLNILLQMGHEHEVASLIPAVMQGMVVGMHQYSSSAVQICGVIGIDVLAHALYKLAGIFLHCVGNKKKCLQVIVFQVLSFILFYSFICLFLFLHYFFFLF